MADKREVLIEAKLRDQVSAEAQRMGQNVKNTTQDMQKGLVALSVAGAAAAASLGLMIKAAADEEAGIVRLSVALKNVGVSYDSVKGSLEGVIAATQEKTGIADEDQRQALKSLVIATGDYNKALALLPLTLDLAAATQLDYNTAARLLGRITDESTNVLTRYGITVREGATATEVLATVQQKVGGTALAMGNTAAGAFAKLKAATSDAAESLGKLMLPIVVKVAGALQSLVETISKLPDWLKKVGLVLGGAVAAGGLIAGLGLLIIQAQKGITAILGLAKALGVMQAFSGPAGWASLAIATGLVVAITQLDIFKTKGVDAFQSVGAAAQSAATDIQQATQAIGALPAFGAGQGQEVSTLYEKQQAMFAAAAEKRAKEEAYQGIKTGVEAARASQQYEEFLQSLRMDNLLELQNADLAATNDMLEYEKNLVQQAREYISDLEIADIQASADYLRTEHEAEMTAIEEKRQKELDLIGQIAEAWRGVTGVLWSPVAAPAGGFTPPAYTAEQLAALAATPLTAKGTPQATEEYLASKGLPINVNVYLDGNQVGAALGVSANDQARVRSGG